MSTSTADAAFADFAGHVDVDRLVSEVADASGQDPTEIRRRATTSLEEAANALRLLWPDLPPPGGRILEVGAGMGLLSHLLASRGYEVVALEPGGIGYEAHVPLAAAVDSLVGGSVTHIDIGGEDLDPDEHGVFDLVFSVNVVEHVDDLDRFLDALLSVVDPGGSMLHSCPNYWIPYEPHFGLPLVPFRPSATARLLPDRIVDSGLWRSLNFVTTSDVRRWARERGLDVDFHSGQMARALRRCATDEEFGARHGPLVPLARLLHRLRVTSLLARLPASLTTPMVFLIRPVDTGTSTRQRSAPTDAR